MSELLKAALLLGFVGLGVRLRLAREPQPRARALRGFIAYAVAASALAGFSQKDAWPFSPYTLAAFRARVDSPQCLTEFVGVDAGGREWKVDTYAWGAVYDSLLQYWFEQSHARLGAGEKREVMAFLLGRAEQARLRLARGERVGYERWLGPAHARYWWLLPRATQAPASPLSGLRVYRVCGVPLELVRRPEARQRALLSAWPE